MLFDRPLLSGRLHRRYKRFLADVELDSGEVITVHCPNTGAMMGCQDPGSRIWLSESSKKTRKYPHTWEIVETGSGTKVGINTARSNALVDEALANDRLVELRGYLTRRREVTVADGRLDFLLSGHATEPDCYLEVKNVTAAVDDGLALFPDAVSARASRHMQALVDKVQAGYRAALVFCVQRGDVLSVSPADGIDPAYGEALRKAAAAGVGLYAIKGNVTTRHITLLARVDVRLPAL